MQPPAPQVDLNSGDHGVILNDGTKVPFNQLQQYDPQLYSQYVQNLGQPSASLNQTQTSTQATGASIPGIQAESGIKQIQGQQVASPISLSKDLAAKMTLPDAIKKYTANGGMKADDVFKQYLAESPWGLPNESVTALQNMGISGDALGKIGTPGSFMDRSNTRSAINELRGLQETFNKTTEAGKIPVIGNLFNKAYNAQKLAVADHLSSLIPGASQSQGSNEGFLRSLPDPSNPADISQANDIFDKIETPLLQSKGYSPKDLGLPSKPSSVENQGGNQTTQPQAQAKGGDILQNGINDILNMGKSIAKTPLGHPLGGILPTLLNPEAVKQDVANQAQTIPSFLKQYADIAQNPLGQLKEHPVNTGMAVLSPLLGLRGASPEAPPEAPEAPVNPINGLPGGLKTFLQPKGAINQAGNLRTSVVNAASDAGKAINGNSIVADLEKWADKGKMGNLGQGDAIDKAIEDAKNIFSGKKIDPKDAATAYSEADSGYTKAGIPKSPIQANIDRGVRDVLAKHLDDVAPGWQKATQSMAKGYAAQKSPVRNIVKAGAKNAVGYGLALSGLDAVKHVLGL